MCDEEEHHRSYTGEQQRGVDGEPSDRWHQEGSSEHGDDMLHPDADRSGPA